MVEASNPMHPNSTLNQQVEFLQNVWNSRYPKTNKTVGYKSMVEAFNFQKSMKVDGKKVTRPVVEQKQLMAELVTKVVANDPKLKEELMAAKGYIVIDNDVPSDSKLGKDATKLLEDTLMRHKMLLEDGVEAEAEMAETKQKDGNITDTGKKNNRHEELKDCMR